MAPIQNLVLIVSCHSRVDELYPLEAASDELVSPPVFVMAGLDPAISEIRGSKPADDAARRRGNSIGVRNIMPRKGDKEWLLRCVRIGR
jgi:hypothetical protein